MNKPIKQLPTFVARTYRGGKEIKRFLGMHDCVDSFYPEDWISSFVEAKNRNYVKNEGLTRVVVNGEEVLLADLVGAEDFGQGRTDSGLLIKYLDSAERLGIQVHPTKAYAREVFNSSYGKTECWHFLVTRNIGEPASIYLGFKEFVTKEIWSELFYKQDIEGMLNAMHRFEVSVGDTVLVTGGTPHAIGGGCFMVEIQEPSDYTMRTEKITLAGDVLTPQQIHYGVGEEKMLDCFDYTPQTREEIKDKYFLKPTVKENIESLVTYENTPCFALDKLCGGEYSLMQPCFVTLIVLETGGSMLCQGERVDLKKGDKYFIPANTRVDFSNAKGLICYPPKL